MPRRAVLERQALDDAQARYEGQSARVNSLQRTVDLAVLGPRPEEIAAARGRVAQARGAIAYAETQRANAVIRAPVSGTVLERAVEKGEFVTTMFVGDRGAKSYVVALADLNDLEVELDISQNDFARLSAGQKSVITTEAFPDRKYDGRISEISPEANRQKATVQVKVKILNPDDYLRPEMNASVAFYSKPVTGAPHTPTVVIPSAAVRDNSVFLVVDGRAVRRPVEVAGATAHGTLISGGLIGGEDVVVDPPANVERRAEGPATMSRVLVGCETNTTRTQRRRNTKHTQRFFSSSIALPRTSDTCDGISPGNQTPLRISTGKLLGD